MQFIYFIPNQSAPRPTAAHFKQLGLAHAIPAAGGNPTSRECTAGPEGQSGWLASYDNGTPALYLPETQIWQAGPRQEMTEQENAAGMVDEKPRPPKYYVGVHTDAPPKPADLARKRQIPGESLVLGDGNTWTIPIAISFAAGRGSTLPARFVIGADGQTWELAETPEFAHLTKHAETIIEAYRTATDAPGGGVTVKLDFAESMRICLDALAVNYHGLGPVEISLLGLITTETRWPILRALIDDIAKEAVDELGEKKTDTPATSAT